MDENRWAGVRERVLALAGHPGAEQVFGLPDGEPLRAPLTRAQLAELEGQIGTRLPEEYRGFLLQVGAGGAGPSYGVFPVVLDADGRWGWEGDGGDMTDPARLGEPFATVRADAAELAALQARTPEEEDFPDDPDAFEAAYDEWDERHSEVLFSGERTIGAICLCHKGCCLRQWLVVSGPEAGTVWDDPRADWADIEPLTGPAGRSLTFAEWYMSWLEEAERTAERYGEAA
ncbi:SMI1/KNR4 family protein [Streptomyces uncialis]|uniref:SMI1/KNR4 family protein n=1 Tax=Streptomyces uncialis TaxID=1048205 RepID=UPI0037F983C6